MEKKLKILKKGVKTVNKKLANLTDEDLKKVVGGQHEEMKLCPKCGQQYRNRHVCTKDE